MTNVQIFLITFTATDTRVIVDWLLYSLRWCSAHHVTEIIRFVYYNRDINKWIMSSLQSITLLQRVRWLNLAYLDERRTALAQNNVFNFVFVIETLSKKIILRRRCGWDCIYTLVWKNRWFSRSNNWLSSIESKILLFIWLNQSCVFYL